MARIRNPFMDRVEDPRSTFSRNARPARIRNARYAPESLEGRLSPSSFGLVAVPAEIATLDGSPNSNAVVIARTEEPLPTDENGDPIPDPASGDEPDHDQPI
jgi:hypothetical protein